MSIAELTGVSATLKSWYIVLLSSLIVLGTCIDLEVRLDNEDNMDDTAFGIAMGVCTSIVAMFFILVHYDFIPQCESIRRDGVNVDHSSYLCLFS